MSAALLHAAAWSVAGGAAALVAWGVTALLRKLRAPSHWQCLLWLAVAVRFAVPGGLLPVALPAPRSEAARQTVQALEQLTAGAAPAALVQLAPAQAPHEPWYWYALAAVWTTGTLVLVGRTVWQYLTLRRTVVLACKTPDGCYRCALDTPFTLGILRPRIYLPDTLQGEARDAVLRHERTHIRRGDTITKPLYYLLVCLHWWNPLAWLAFHQFTRAMEAACDEAATQGHSPAERACYCETLLAFVSNQAPVGSLAFGQGSLKERIAHILHYRRPTRTALACCAAAVLAGMGMCLARPVAAATVTPEPPLPIVSTPEPTLMPTPTPEPTPEPEQPFTLTFGKPLETTLFCTRMFCSSHTGDDLAAPHGTPVLAVAAGTVRLAEFDPVYGYHIILDHGCTEEGQSVQTLYAHLDELMVRAGDPVDAGQQIGTVGTTGNSTGPHLHLELRVGEETLPPSEYIPYEGV